MKESRTAKKPAAATEAESGVPALAESDLPADGGIRLTLPGFEGPLDLLLHLIQEHELDILNIPIAFITKRYLEYMGLMQELDIDIASEYLVMAATLAHIKSRMLLPTPPADLEDGEEDELDPRAELIRRLLEYQKYKKAAEELASRAVLGRDVFVRGVQPALDLATAPLAPVQSFKLLEAFQRVLTRAKITIDHQIEFERFSLSDRINQLVDLLKGRGRVIFEALFEGQHSRADLIVTFLALLELTRLRMTYLFQNGALEPIYIELSVSDDEAPNAGWQAAELNSTGGEVPKPGVERTEPGMALKSDAIAADGTRMKADLQHPELDEELEDDLDDFDLAALGLNEDELDDEESNSPQHAESEPGLLADESSAVERENAIAEVGNLPDNAVATETSGNPETIFDEEREVMSVADLPVEGDATVTSSPPEESEAVERLVEGDAEEGSFEEPQPDLMLTEDAIAPSADSEFELK